MLILSVGLAVSISPHLADSAIEQELQDAGPNPMVNRHQDGLVAAARRCAQVSSALQDRPQSQSAVRRCSSVDGLLQLPIEGDTVEGASDLCSE